MMTAPISPLETPENRIHPSFDTPVQHQMYVWNCQSLDGQNTDTAEMSDSASARYEAPVAVTVLVVDDERSIALLLAELLESAGYRVVVASTGRAALALARSERPSLILTDCTMPGVDGVELVRRLRGSPVTNTIPIVMMSSIRPRLAPRDDAAELRLPEERILRTGNRGLYLAIVGDACLPFLEKPFDLDVVLDVVETATE
jgi:CheY-like chemotaxis protein